ncbi:hypothetical protein RJ640_023392 [Escallonia rubra]|uniref:Uncharacterized protein n=1 Tax=Escallonia rubra TaxID=112253 RepID=A0AA88UF04_9ASTE|nr:hypothetical protein RJ640_023392 [Escallonia rubra]
MVRKTFNKKVFVCRKIGTSVDEQEFESLWKPEASGYSRKLIEFYCSKALNVMCCDIQEEISDGSFSRFTFDMMLAWEMPCSDDEESYKVDQDRSVGEDAFVWLGTLVPLVVDVVNGRFTFETLTASTANRLHFPAYDRFLKEIDRCIKHLQKQTTPKGVELADDEFILHVEGTASTQRVVRHIGGASWPGRLTLTNYALYFETSGVISYEDAIKLDLSKDVDQSVKPAATGPWGAPLFDKAIVYESSELQDGVVLEFPEMTSSTRRDHWLALVKEVILLHRFLSKFKVESPVQAWEVHARAILGIVRLHAAREMLRISPPVPRSFLIFALFDELPKGDYVLQELAESLKKVDCSHPCSASSILRSMNISRPCAPCAVVKEISEKSGCVGDQVDNLSSLEGAINQVREEAKEIDIAKATAQGLKEEGIGESALILKESLKPLANVLPRFEEILTWERPEMTVIAIGTILLVVYKEWVGKAIATFLLWLISKMVWARRQRIGKRTKIIVCTASDQTTVESLVSAQHGLKTVQYIMQLANITILKIWSILLSRSPKHTDIVMMAITGAAIVLAVVPFKYIIMALVLYCFTMTSKLKKHVETQQGNRRLKEWWDSIPIVPVEVVDKAPGYET